MRTLTADGLREMLAEETSHVFIPAIAVSHDSFATLYMVANSDDVTYDGDVYTATQFSVTLAPDLDDQIPQVTLRIDNVNRDMIDELRTYNTAPDIALKILRLEPPSWAAYLEIDAGDFAIKAIQYSASTIEATLGFESDYLNEPACAIRFDPTVAPGLF